MLGGKPPADSRIGSLFRRMLVYSDNGAANDLQVWLGGGSIYTGSARVTTTLRALGLYDSYINGGYILGTADRKPIPLNVVEQPSYYSTGQVHVGLGSRPDPQVSPSGRGRQGTAARPVRPFHGERRALPPLHTGTRPRPGESSIAT